MTLTRLGRGGPLQFSGWWTGFINESSHTEPISHFITVEMLPPGGASPRPFITTKGAQGCPRCSHIVSSPVRVLLFLLPQPLLFPQPGVGCSSLPVRFLKYDRLTKVMVYGRKDKIMADKLMHALSTMYWLSRRFTSSKPSWVVNSYALPSFTRGLLWPKAFSISVS